MINKSSIYLPLHYGHPPQYLLARMKRLAFSISKIFIAEHGTTEFLKRLADPLWFQSFGCVLGFDWHSSGLTTVVTGVLQHSIDLQNHGILISGGKGKKSSLPKNEIPKLAQSVNLNGKRGSDLLYASKMAAKVDNGAVQDGYNLYHHVIFFNEHGHWTVVQQGMNTGFKMARRYHWSSDNIHNSFLNVPHSGIICDRTHENVLDLTSTASIETQKTSIDLVRGNPQNLINTVKKLELQKSISLDDWISNNTDGWEKIAITGDYKMPRHLNWKVINKVYDIQPVNYEELISIDGVGPSLIRALSLISMLIYGSQASWKDPVRYSFAHGGKDGVPFPVDRRTYDKSIMFLKDAIEGGEISSGEKKMALKKLFTHLNAILPAYSD